MRRELWMGGLLAGAALLASHTSPAFDFGAISNAMKNLDVNKAVDVGKKIVASTTEMPLDQEIALGNDLTARLLGAMPPLNDPAIQSYVNRVGRWLSLQTSRPDLPWRFVVVDTDSLGAFAAPGGNVVITAGLMRLMRDENELAGVLAHEITHVVEKHHLHAIMKQARLSLARDVVSEYTSTNPLVTETLMNAGMNLYSSGLDQSDELAADKGGTVLAARSGYDALGLLLVLTTLDSIDTHEPRGALLFATHPPTRERIDRLADLADVVSSTDPGMLLDANRFTTAQSQLFSP